MKIKSLVIATALAGGLLSSASAITAAARVEAPVPVKTVQPVQLPWSHGSSIVNLSMIIDREGNPHHVRVLDVRDQTAYRRIIATVSQWRFSPARRNGQAIAARVELPLEVKGL